MLNRLVLATLSLICSMVLVACSGGGSSSTPTYTVGGAIAGLSSGSLVLKNNGGDTLTINGNSTTFTFSTALASGATYNATIGAQPSGLTCTVTNGTGTVATGNVTNITVTCAATSYSVGGTVSGLSAGSSIVLQDNSFNTATVSSNGSYIFSTALANGTHYTVSIQRQPNNLNCSVANGTGTLSGADVANVNVTCSAAFVYVTNAVSNTLSTYPINSDGTLGAPSSVLAGLQPLSMTFSPGRAYAYVPNYGASSVSMYAVGNDGSLSATLGAPVTTGYEPKTITLNPAGTYAYVTNQGSREIWAYSVTNGVLHLLTVVSTGAYSPQAMAINSAGTYAYVVTSNGPLLTYPINSDGSLSTPINVLSGSSTDAIAINPAGTYVYVTNITSSSVWVHPINTNGSLGSASSTAPTGNIPEGITINPTGTYAYVVNNGNNSVTIYPINGDGSLGTPSAAPTGNGPIGFAINQAGTFAYVTNSIDNTVSVYQIRSDGSLAVSSTTQTTGLSFPYGIAISY